MAKLFEGDEDFNQDISSWEVNSVTTNMDGMFTKATSSNQDLSGWCVPNTDKEPSNFSTGSALSEEHHPVWGTCPQ